MNGSVARHPAWWAILFFLTALFLYANTWKHKYVYDDQPLYTNNEFVQQGFAGLKGIFTHDAFYTHYTEREIDSHLAGGRFRPLTLATYALEVEWAGQNNNIVSHIVNILLYGFTMVALWQFLSMRLFKEQYTLAAIITLLFLVHPVHTEVVANIKSRDEILCLLFLLLTFIFAFKHLALTLVSFSLALLSKEFAATAIFLVPLLGFLERRNWKENIRIILPMLLLLSSFVAWRIHLFGFGAADTNTEILNNPFLLATWDQGFATRCLVIWKYVGLLIWPHPLSYDYSYNQIPYTHPADFRVLAVVLLHLGILYWMWAQRSNRSPLLFAGAFYFLTLGMVSNFILNTGTIMSERMIFHPSLGFCIAVGVGLHYVSKQSALARHAVRAGLVLMALVWSGLTLHRNPDWASEQTLYLKDVHVVPNSNLANCNAGAVALEKYYEATNEIEQVHFFEQAMAYTQRALDIHPKDLIAQMNMGCMLFHKGKVDQAVEYWEQARQLLPGHPSLKKYDDMASNHYRDVGYQLGLAGDFEGAEQALTKAVKHNTGNAWNWYYLGGAHFEQGQTEAASKVWAKLPQNVQWSGFDADPILDP